MPRDLFGREIAVGDVIVYPVRFSSVVVMKALTVTGTEPSPDGLLLVGSRAGRVIKVKANPRHVVVVPGASQ